MSYLVNLWKVQTNLLYERVLFNGQKYYTYFDFKGKPLVEVL